MKTFLKWLGRTVGAALALIMVIVLLPYASRLINAVLPDLSGAATTMSVTLARQMENTARLETSVVEDEGVMVSSTDALFLGEVQKVTVRYTYRASIGIDLSKVQLHVRGNTITMQLPALEVLSDSLTPEEIIRDDFWYPVTDERMQTLLAAEKERCRSHYLEQNEQNDQAWENTITALEDTVAQWITLGRNGVTIQYSRPQ